MAPPPRRATPHQGRGRVIHSVWLSPLLYSVCVGIIQLPAGRVSFFREPAGSISTSYFILILLVMSNAEEFSASTLSAPRRRVSLHVSDAGRIPAPFCKLPNDGVDAGGDLGQGSVGRCTRRNGRPTSPSEPARRPRPTSPTTTASTAAANQSTTWLCGEAGISMTQRPSSTRDAAGCVIELAVTTLELNRRLPSPLVKSSRH